MSWLRGAASLTAKPAVRQECGWSDAYILPFTTSDHNYDSGTLSIEPNGEWRIVAPTDPGPEPHTTGGDMVLWSSRDERRNWKRLRTLTRAAAHNHTYARKPVGARPDFYWLWADGDTLKRSDSYLYFATRDGDVYRLPPVMKSETARPARLRRPGARAFSGAGWLVRSNARPHFPAGGRAAGDWSKNTCLSTTAVLCRRRLRQRILTGRRRIGTRCFAGRRSGRRPRTGSCARRTVSCEWKRARRGW